MPDSISAPNAARLEYKALGGNSGTTLLAADDVTGVVEALVSVTGIPDEVNDIIMPGAYKDSLAKRKPKVIFGHDWQKWVARTEEVKELLPGDPALPKTARDGNPWPAAAGALYMKAKFNLDTPEGKSCYSNVRFFSETGECEWSIGYRVPTGQSTRTKSGQRAIRKLDLFEASPVLFGAAPLSGTLTVKDAKGAPEFEDKATGAAADPNRWATDDPSDPVDPDTREADADDPTMAALHAEMIREVSAQADGWDAVDAASAINPGEEEITSETAAMLRDTDERRQGVKDAGGDALEHKAGDMKVSDKPWAGFSQADYTPAQWHAACLVHNHAIGPGGVGGDGMTKADCHLPISEPDGTVNRNAVHAAAGRLSRLDASDDQKNAAAAKLRSLYGKIGDDAPDSLSTKTAGQDVTPADHAAADRLKQWYEHGGGAAQIGWGKAGDFDACVAIAGKHMDPAKAKGYCQLRHKGATGFYAGHAPSEQAAHGAAAATVGKKGIIDPETLVDATDFRAELKSKVEDAVGYTRTPGVPYHDPNAEAKAAAYDPALEQGEYAGHLPSEVKALDTEAPYEERVDAVTAAVTAALGSTVPGEQGMPRKLVTVHGTWPDRALASVHDAHGPLSDAKSFSVPYTYDPDAGVTLGDPEPVTLTLPASDGTKALGGEGEALSAVPVLVEYVAGFIRRGLAGEVKAGRVLSDSNAKLLQGAHQQLVTVLRSAGIPVDTGSDPDEEEQALNDQESAPLYLPDSTAPAAQAAGTKVALDPELLSRASLITAAAGTDE